MLSDLAGDPLLEPPLPSPVINLSLGQELLGSLLLLPGLGSNSAPTSSQPVNADLSGSKEGDAGTCGTASLESLCQGHTPHGD